MLVPRQRSNLSHYLASPTGVNDPLLLGFRPPAPPTPQHTWAESIPATMPWSTPSDQLMRFTAQSPLLQSQAASPTSAYPTPTLVSDPCTSAAAAAAAATAQWAQYPAPVSAVIRNTSSQLKRRNSSDDDSDSNDMPPAKITLTEEKVAARFNNLNLNTDDDSVDDDLFLKVSSDAEEIVAEPGVQLSDELRSVLNAERNCPVEKLIKDDMAKASMAVIVWTPPLANIVSTAQNESVATAYTTESPSSEPSDVSDVEERVEDGPIIEEVVDEEEEDMMDL